MQKRRVLIVDNNDELRDQLREVLGRLGHEVVTTANREEAFACQDLESFDLFISDLTEDAESTDESVSELHRNCLLTPVNGVGGEKRTEIVKAFKLGAGNFVRHSYNREQLRELVEQTLRYKLRYIDEPSLLSHTHEKIIFELPSDLLLMNGVLQYLLERVSKLALVNGESSNLFIALDEAFVNAVKHGNKSDPAKLVRITAELSPKEASFTVEDEGDGFNVDDIPDPRDPANLFKTSGRGVLLIYNIMDEVEYNAQGNRVKMIKRPETTAASLEPQPKLIESISPDDKHA
jgi:serine/threonine-protein kinase RsbW